MSGRTFRRTIVFALALSAGLVSASSAHAIRVRADREPAIRQEASIRTLIGNAWDSLRNAFSNKEMYGPPAHTPQPEGPGLCPLGKPGRTGQPGNGN